MVSELITTIFDNKVAVLVTSAVCLLTTRYLSTILSSRKMSHLLVKELDRTSFKVAWGAKEPKYINANDVPTLVREMREFYNSGVLKCVNKRKEQLKQIRKLLENHDEEINQALQTDLGRHRLEAIIFDISSTLAEVDYLINNIDSLAKPKSVGFNLATFPSNQEVLREPYGLCCVVGTWNFPFQLALTPLAAAISGGNSTILQVPSKSYASQILMEKLIPQYLDPGVVQVVGSGFKDDIEASATLLKERFDLIFYTGSTQGGKHVAKAAAVHLTPTILELGGKNPTIVDGTVDPYVAAKRIMLGRLANCGQVCISPDYLLCKKEAIEPLVEQIKVVLKEFYPDGTKAKSEDGCNVYGRIICDSSMDRLINMIESHDGEVLIGGKYDKADRYIEPTVLKAATLDSPTLKEEAFGPILTIVEIPSVEDAIDYINSREKPLALHCFSDDKHVQKMVKYNTSSGALVINGCIVQNGHSGLPFGGVGNSGMGKYHGKYSFEAFTHPKTVLKKWQMPVLGDPSFLYPPYNSSKEKILKFLV